MADENGVQVIPTAVDAQADDAAKTFPADYVQQLRQEAASYRTKLREFEEAQKQAEEQRLAQQQAEEQRLAQQQEWQKLAEQRAAEVEALRPFQEKYSAMLEAIKAGNEKRIEQIPEGMRTLIPPIDDPATLTSWLDTNWQLLTGKTPAPSLNGSAGQGQTRTQSVTLTDAELQIATKMGLTPEQYMSAKSPKR